MNFTPPNRAIDNAAAVLREQRQNRGPFEASRQKAMAAAVSADLSVPERSTMSFHAPDLEGIARVRLCGELDLELALRGEDALSKFCQANPALIVDLSEVTFIDSRGLNAVLTAVRAAGHPGIVVLPSNHLQPRRFFTMSGAAGIGAITAADDADN